MTGHIARVVNAHIACDHEGCTRTVEAYTTEDGTTTARARAILQGWKRSPRSAGLPVKDFCPRHRPTEETP